VKVPNTWGPTTVLIVAVVLIAVVAGGVVCIAQPDTLSFPQYLDDLKAFAIATGVLSVGRGLYLGGVPLTSASVGLPLKSALAGQGAVDDEDDLAAVPSLPSAESPEPPSAGAPVPAPQPFGQQPTMGASGTSTTIYPPPQG
jgi:hypothetical protein